MKAHLFDSPQFGMLQRESAAAYWFQQTHTAQQPCPVCIVLDVDYPTIADEKDALARACERLAPLWQAFASGPQPFKSHAARWAADIAEDWHLPEEGEFGQALLEEKMSAHMLYLHDGQAHYLVYRVDAMPSPYDLTVELDASLQITEVSIR
jgi:hypothetical protein